MGVEVTAVSSPKAGVPTQIGDGLAVIKRTLPAKLQGLAFFNSIIHAIERLGAEGLSTSASVAVVNLPRPNTRLCLFVPAHHALSQRCSNEPLLCSPSPRRRLSFSTFFFPFFLFLFFFLLSPPRGRLPIVATPSPSIQSVLAFSPTSFFRSVDVGIQASLHVVLSALPQCAFMDTKINSNCIL